MASPSSNPSLHGARVLVTGLRSFTGRYLEEALTRSGAEVFGTVAPLEGLAHDAANVHVADLLDAQALARAVDAVRPTHVVHLAAISFVAHGDVEAIYRTNVVGTRNLLAALADQDTAALKCVLLASSANIYGNAVDDPINEATPTRPANDYAVSKLAMELMASLWRSSLPLTIVRPFNYTGVGQSAKFLVPKIVNAYRQKAASLELGNLDVERDFSDVRDVVEAYVHLLAKPAPRTVNICSGRATSLKDILAMTERLSGHWLDVRVNPAFVRSDEVRRLRGDPKALHDAMGAVTTRPLTETLEWMLSAPGD